MGEAVLDIWTIRPRKVAAMETEVESYCMLLWSVRKRFPDCFSFLHVQRVRIEKMIEI